ncbi:hypothetical protein BGI30_11540 [Snodgrassella alvi]|jgi:hypothetical protein|uniref:antiviral reverse transcriptase Drt3a n=1 Tax=Snodgrassella alvi TaxID=1196083 RepID=UPI000C1E943B|nr:antiviral reverse transcriptase Drt3a [Snodgrassella alvi]PIT07010.1 hypothetical protein BGI30_11540 [Snodgrassella alvi]PIT56454.1 hypothetical protein BHC59_08190 [Snodgrassella alvi]
MERQAFSEIALSQIQRKFFPNENINNRQDTNACNAVKMALKRIENKSLFDEGSISSFSLKNNTVYQLKSLEAKIIERKIILNLKQVFNIQTVSRVAIVQRLKLILAECVPYMVYRLDIKQFFESFHSEVIEKTIYNDIRLSPQTTRLIKDLFGRYKSLKGSGCPRGLAISSVITEILMQNFDAAIRNIPNCFFYARYVDDIIIITSKTKDANEFEGNIEKLLPMGLKLNKQKTEKVDYLGNKYKDNSSENKSETTENNSFEYLGYKYIINKESKNNNKKIIVDMADKKCSKYQFKIIRAFYDFYRNKDCKLLEDRIKFLTCNYKITKNYGSTEVLAGIYFNYPEISEEQVEQGNLKKLDKLLQTMLLSNKSRLTKLISPLLKQEIKNNLIKYSFVQGHKKKTFIKFDPKRLVEIKKCWEH